MRHLLHIFYPKRTLMHKSFTINLTNTTFHPTFIIIIFSIPPTHTNPSIYRTLRSNPGKGRRGKTRRGKNSSRGNKRRANRIRHWRRECARRNNKLASIRKKEVYYLASDRTLRDAGFQKTASGPQIWWGENDAHRHKKCERKRRIVLLENTGRGSTKVRMENSGNRLICTLPN